MHGFWGLAINTHTGTEFNAQSVYTLVGVFAVLLLLFLLLFLSSFIFYFKHDIKLSAPLGGDYYLHSIIVYMIISKTNY